MSLQALATNPVVDPEDHDTILMEGKRSPGVVTLSGHEREIQLDVKQSDGTKGAATTYKGEKAAEFTATFRLVYDPSLGVDDFADWEAFAPIFWSTVPPISGAKPVAKDIWHPDLGRNGINSCILRKMGGMSHDGRGGATIAVTLAEYYPPKPAPAGGASGSKSKKPDPNDPIAVRTKQLEDALNEGKVAPAKKSGGLGNL